MHIEELQVENLRLEIWMWCEMEIPYEKKRLDFAAGSSVRGFSDELWAGHGAGRSKRRTGKN